MARPKPERVRSGDERQTLATWAARPKSTQRLAPRARIVRACAGEPGNKAVAARPGVCGATVGPRRNRFVARRLEGPADEPRPGAPRAVTDDAVGRAVTATPEAGPTDATRRSTRGMARAGGLSPSTVGRIRRAFGPKPHRADTFELSADPYFAEKVRDVVGLYPSPPEKAIVLCADEKPRAQARERTRPALPMAPARTGRGAHDYTRHGTASLFAAPDVATGSVIGRCRRRHRSQEFVRFPDHVDASPPRGPGVSVRIVLDNYGTHKTAAVKRWLLRHPGYRLHVIPTSGPWLNPVERFSAVGTGRRIRRGVLTGVAQRERAVADYPAEHNRNPKPFAWTATADAILERLKRVCERTSDSGH